MCKCDAVNVETANLRTIPVCQDNLEFCLGTTNGNFIPHFSTKRRAFTIEYEKKGRQTPNFLCQPAANVKNTTYASAIFANTTLMCGRYVMDMGHSEIRDIYRNLQEVPPLLRWDVFPSQLAPVFTGDELLPSFLKWGFDSPYGGGLLINARAETVMEKPFFAKDFALHRCVVPCSGFYEWDSDKNKHLFERADGKVLYLAGFCKMQGEQRFVILTKTADKPVENVHHRTPALLDKTQLEEFLHNYEYAKQAIASNNCVKLLSTT